MSQPEPVSGLNAATGTNFPPSPIATPSEEIREHHIYRCDPRNRRMSHVRWPVTDKRQG